MMNIQITKTDDLVTLDGVECRRWEGVTEGGVECDVFVHRIKVADEKSGEFEAELVEMPIPSGGI